MDTGNGTFARISAERAKAIKAAMGPTSGVFHVGEELITKGSIFRITAIRRKGLKLKLLKGSL